MEINTFGGYLKEPHTLTFDQMQQLHEEMVQEIGNDFDARELYDDLVDVATKYAAIRAKWQSVSREDKMNQDSMRTSHHNSVIIHFNMLARYLRMQGKKQNGGIDSDMKKRIGIFGRQLVISDAISYL